MCIDSTNNILRKLSVRQYRSEELFIRPIQVIDLQYLFDLRTAPGINQYLYSSPPGNMEQQQEWFAVNQQHFEDMYFMLFLTKSLENPVGYCQLVKIDGQEQAAESGLVIDPTRIISGVVTMKLVMAMLKIAFNFYPINTIYSSVSRDNYPSCHFFEAFMKSTVIKGEHKYRKSEEILYCTQKAQFEEKLQMLYEKNKKWQNALELCIVE